MFRILGFWWWIDSERLRARTWIDSELLGSNGFRYNGTKSRASRSFVPHFSPRNILLPLLDKEIRRAKEAMSTERGECDHKTKNIKNLLIL